MAITLGKDGAAPPIGGGIINATYTEEVETVDISNRANVGAGYKQSAAGFTVKTWEIECHEPTGVVDSLQDNSTTGGFTVV